MIITVAVYTPQYRLICKYSQFSSRRIIFYVSSKYKQAVTSMSTRSNLYLKMLFLCTSVERSVLVGPLEMPIYHTATLCFGIFFKVLDKKHVPIQYDFIFVNFRSSTGYNRNKRSKKYLHTSHCKRFDCILVTGI